MDTFNANPQPYASAIVLATFSLLLAILITPPMLWHLSNRNIGATSLIIWLLLLNLLNFLNAVIWPHDDLSQWFSGNILCDIEVKLMIAAGVGVPCSVASVLRALARVMDTERAGLGLSKGQRRRGYAVDLLWCVGFPVLQMFLHYIVQTERYYLVGISGCSPAVSSSWVSDLLIWAPPAIWALVGGYYAALILIRLHRYRRNFAALLAHSNTNRSRFVRLFAICLVWLAISLPLQIYVISQRAAVPHLKFVWSLVHDPEAWSTIEMAPSGGEITYTRYIWLGSAVMVFLFFGFGRDASRMYAKGLRGIGLGKCLPFLRLDQTTTRSASHAGTVNSVSSRAKLFFRRQSSSASLSVKSWATDSRSSKATASSSVAEPLSPKMMKHLETVEENSRLPFSTKPAPTGKTASRLSHWLSGRGQNATHDIEKNLPAAPKEVHAQSGFHRLTSPFRSVTALQREQEDAMPMDILKTQDVTVQSTVAGGPISPASRRVADQGGVLVRKDVRQGSEAAAGMF